MLRSPFRSRSERESSRSACRASYICTLLSVISCGAARPACRFPTDDIGDKIMRAILLAAGRGSRLQQSTGEQFPKCLLRFDGVTLLERHLRMLDAAGVAQIVLALGFQSKQVEGELDRFQLGLDIEIVLNARWELG